MKGRLNGRPSILPPPAFVLPAGHPFGYNPRIKAGGAAFYRRAARSFMRPRGGRAGPSVTAAERV